MTSPFDWRNTPSRIDWSDLDKANRLSSSMSARICSKRANGQEPSIIADLGAKTAGDPRKFVTKGRKA